MAHLGLTPQSVNALAATACRAAARTGAAAAADAKALQDAGAFAVVLELVPADLAAEVTAHAARSRPSASAPAPAPTRRSWCGRTWPASPAAGCRSSSSSTPTCTAAPRGVAGLGGRGRRRRLPRRRAHLRAESGGRRRRRSSPHGPAGTLRDGLRVVIRSLVPEDRDDVEQGFGESPSAPRPRFMTGKDHLSQRTLDSLVDQVDQHDHVAVAMWWSARRRPTCCSARAGSSG